MFMVLASWRYSPLATLIRRRRTKQLTLTDLRKMVYAPAKLVEIFLTAIREHTGGTGPMVDASTKRGLKRCGQVSEHLRRGLSVRKVRAETAACHTLESEGKDAIIQTGLDEEVRIVEGGAPSRAVVVDVSHRDSCHSELV